MNHEPGRGRPGRLWQAPRTVRTTRVSGAGEDLPGEADQVSEIQNSTRYRNLARRPRGQSWWMRSLVEIPTVALVTSLLILSVGRSASGGTSNGLVQARLLQRAAEASTSRVFTARYRVLGTAYRSTYSQNPPKALVVETGLPHGTSQSVLTIRDRSVTCSTSPSKTRPHRTCSAGVGMERLGAPQETLADLDGIISRMRRGQNVDVSTRRYAGLLSTCFSGPNAGTSPTFRECFTSGGILAALTGTSGIGAELTAYSPRSAIGGVTLPKVRPIGS